MRVFLAGATGHVGSGIRAALLEAGHHVTGLARRAERLADEPHVTAVSGDVGEPAAWRDAVEGHDAVVNAVGLLRESGRNTFRRAVVEGTRHLVEAARAHGVPRFVQVSANGVEAARVPYQTTKLEAEELVRQSGLTWTILRPSIIYGPDDDFTNRFARLMRLGAVPYFGRGDYRLAPVAVWDVGAVAAACLTKPAAAHEVFHLCGPESLAFRDFLREVRAAAGRKAVVAYAPKWVGYAGAALLGWMKSFPADTDALTMLFQGNTCTDDRWPRVFGIRPTPFCQGIRRYLGPNATLKPNGS